VKRSDVSTEVAGVPIREPKPRLRIVRLEEWIAPGIAVNHNEIILRETARSRR
jgi:hypothetical protein